MKLTDDIINYVKYLQTEAELFLSIKPTKYDTYINKNLAFLDMHYNPYCLFMKSTHSGLESCIDIHNRIVSGDEKSPFFVMCDAGVWEFVYPVFSGDVKVCTVNVSGYCFDGQRAKKAVDSCCEQLGNDKKETLEIYERSMNKNVPDTEKISAVIYPLIYMLELAYKDCPPLENDDLYTRILYYLNIHHNEKIVIEDMANTLHYSPSSIHHVFKKENGMSINAYISELRMKEAKNLIETTALSITEIAYAVGIPDSGYFSKLFKKHFGVSPTDLRKNGNV